MRARRPLSEPVDVPTFAPGDKVRVTAGLAAGVVGVVQSKWGSLFGAMPMYRIQSSDLVRDRILRADWLEPVTAT